MHLPYGGRKVWEVLEHMNGQNAIELSILEIHDTLTVSDNRIDLG